VKAGGRLLQKKQLPIATTLWWDCGSLVRMYSSMRLAAAGQAPEQATGGGTVGKIPTYIPASLR
jgi:hypothetical protein